MKKKVIFDAGNIGMRLKGNKIVEIIPSSQAKKLGVRVGWTVREVNGEIQSNNQKKITQAISKTNSLGMQTIIFFDINDNEPVNITLEEMTNKDVIEWFKSLKYTKTAQIARDESINGKVISMFNKEDFSDMGLPTRGFKGMQFRSKLENLKKNGYSKIYKKDETNILPVGSRVIITNIPPDWSDVREGDIAEIIKHLPNGRVNISLIETGVIYSLDCKYLELVKTKLVNFQPGSFGMTFDGNIVSEIVTNGQAYNSGIGVGWIISEVNGMPQPNHRDAILQAIKKAEQSGKPTEILFQKQHGQVCVTLCFQLDRKSKNYTTKIEANLENDIRSIINKAKKIIKNKKLLEDMSLFETNKFGITLPNSDTFIDSNKTLRSLPTNSNIKFLVKKRTEIAIVAAEITTMTTILTSISTTATTTTMTISLSPNTRSITTITTTKTTKTTKTQKTKNRVKRRTSGRLESLVERNFHGSISKKLLRPSISSHKDEDLYIACRQNQINRVQQLIKAKADVNKKNDAMLCNKGHMLVDLGKSHDSEWICNGSQTASGCKSGFAFISQEIAITRFKCIICKHDLCNNCCNAHCGATPLFESCHNGTLHIAKELIKAKANPNEPNNNGDTSLLIACKNLHLTTVQELIQAKALMNQSNKDEWTPLLISCSNGNEKLVNLLVTKQADIEKSFDNGCSPIYIACEFNHIKVVKELLRLKANVEKSCCDGGTPFKIASQMGHSIITKELLDHHADIENADKNGFRPLHSACEHGHVDVVAQLLEQNADLNPQPKDGRTPLYISCWKKQITIIEKLITGKADVNKAKNNGCSPLFIAAKEGYANIVKKLICAKADIGQFKNSGHTSLHVASQFGHIAVVKELIQSNAKIEKTTKNGDTPLMISSFYGNDDIVRFLISAKADVNKVDCNGETAIYSACQKGYLDIVQQLLDVKANMNIENTVGSSPLKIAKQNRHRSVVITLLNEGRHTFE